MIDREVRTTRIIAAPRERVFLVWTDPTQLARWWGPNGFTNTLHGNRQFIHQTVAIGIKSIGHMHKREVKGCNINRWF